MATTSITAYVASHCEFNNSGKSCSGAWLRVVSSGKKQKKDRRDQQGFSIKETGKNQTSLVASVRAVSISLRDIGKNCDITLHVQSQELCDIINEKDSVSVLRDLKNHHSEKLISAYHNLLDGLARHKNVTAEFSAANDPNMQRATELAKAHKPERGIKAGKRRRASEKRRRLDAATQDMDLE